ncbi:MAG: dTDP-4-dehydrorhamnose 3,5-epimerase family protein, partial [Actinomycetia bacterium]|nr:dTDP-4-dehydrorhamnose 3,5-epimerase family protein [Actinomycetes bacterium]
IVRAFHVHKVLWDWFFVSHGSAKFALVDGRRQATTFNETNTFILSDRKPQLLVIAPGVYHGWMSLEDDTQMISTASEVYNRDNPDEERVPFDSFGYDWNIKFK